MEILLLAGWRRYVEFVLRCFWHLPQRRASRKKKQWLRVSWGCKTQRCNFLLSWFPPNFKLVNNYDNRSELFLWFKYERNFMETAEGFSTPISLCFRVLSRSHWVWKNRKTENGFWMNIFFVLKNLFDFMVYSCCLTATFLNWKKKKKRDIKRCVNSFCIGFHGSDQSLFASVKNSKW